MFKPNETKYFISVSRIGSRLGSTYFFNSTSGIFVRCGCFFGSISEFMEEVDKTFQEINTGLSIWRL